MAEKLKLECPKCKTKLLIRYQEGIEKKNIICPKCKTKSVVANCNPQREQEPSDADTQVLNGWYMPTKTIGQLVYSRGSEMQVFELKEGVNIIGRKTEGKSMATIQIEDPQKTLSRRHLILTVKEVENHYEHELAMANTKTNRTTLNGDTLEAEDIIVLNYGDVIRCGAHRFEFTEK